MLKFSKSVLTQATLAHLSYLHLWKYPCGFSKLHPTCPFVQIIHNYSPLEVEHYSLFIILRLELDKREINF